MPPLDSVSLPRLYELAPSLLMWIPFIVALWKDNPYWRQMLVAMAAFYVSTASAPQVHHTGLSLIMFGVMTLWVSSTQPNQGVVSNWAYQVIKILILGAIGCAAWSLAVCGANASLLIKQPSMWAAFVMIAMTPAILGIDGLVCAIDRRRVLKNKTKKPNS